MERTRQMRRIRSAISDACVYVISFISAAVFIVEILDWMMTV